MAKQLFKQLIASLVVGMALVCTGPVGQAAPGDCMWGCCARPACGKVCKLVCEEKKLTVVGYGSECKDICVPGPGQGSCKHCCVKCCGDGTCCDGACSPCDPCCPACQPEAAKLEFCWRDWVTCGCARPRSIRVLTKYQAERKICWYHWEVVDACACDDSESTTENVVPGYPSAYKPAPAEAQIGDVIELSNEEQTQLASWAPATDATDAAVVRADAIEATRAETTGEATEEAQSLSMWQRMTKTLRLAGKSE